nr:hypothetical protein [Tessaracoccus sp.]
MTADSRARAALTVRPADAGGQYLVFIGVGSLPKRTARPVVGRPNAVSASASSQGRTSLLAPARGDGQGFAAAAAHGVDDAYPAEGRDVHLDVDGVVRDRTLLPRPRLVPQADGVGLRLVERDLAEEPGGSSSRLWKRSITDRSVAPDRSEPTSAVTTFHFSSPTRSSGSSSRTAADW